MIRVETMRGNHSTVGTGMDSDYLAALHTTPAVPREPHSTPLRRGLNTPQTVPDVEPGERGDKDQRDEAQYANASHLASDLSVQEDESEAIRARSELAERVRGRVDDILPLLGQVAFAPGVQLLKRELSRCHDVLRDNPSQSDFLSIVTLVESALSQLSWKQYTKEHLTAIRNAFDVGYQQVRVSFEDYQAVCDSLRLAGIESSPRIDLDALNLEDLMDEED